MQGCAAESDNFLRIAVDAEEKSKYYVKEYSVLALCGRYLILTKRKERRHGSSQMPALR